MRVELFDFELPEALIATHPAEPRDHARLLQVSKFFFDFRFDQLAGLLSPGDILVVNDSKVIPARLFAKKGESAIELLLHRPDGDDQKGQEWRAFARPGKKLKIADQLIIAEGFTAEVVAKHESGEVTLRFNLSGEAFDSALEQNGHMPLPPYIKRADQAADKADYQTVYAAHPGSVAAPTAGLHFTESLLNTIKAKGIGVAHVTLHVGAGTFQPVKVADTSEHVMHYERAEISAESAAQINAARAAGGKVVAVGTTALRTLESAAALDGTLGAWQGDTNLFITPGYQFKIVDRLVTNFHLPKSTLFMLVCAFSGLERMQAAYEYAKQSGYRFYSYGDACLLDRL